MAPESPATVEGCASLAAQFFTEPLRTSAPAVQDTTLCMWDGAKSLLEFVKPGLHLQSGMLLGWDHFGQLLFRFLMFWLVGQIGPFVGILPMIVEFLGTVFVTNVPPVFSADRCVAFSVRRNCWSAWHQWVPKLCFDGRSIKPFRNFQPRKIHQGGINVDQAYGL